MAFCVAIFCGWLKAIKSLFWEDQRSKTALALRPLNKWPSFPVRCGLLFLQYFNWNCFTCNNKGIESIFIIWLNRRSGKKIDWLTERATRDHLALVRDFPHWSRKKSSLFDQMHDKFFIDQVWLVKMASLFFAFLLTSTSSCSRTTQKKKKN